MKVWVLVGRHGYEDTWIEGVFSDLGKASTAKDVLDEAERKKCLKYWQRDYYDIEEFEVDA